MDHEMLRGSQALKTLFFDIQNLMTLFVSCPGKKSYLVSRWRLWPLGFPSERASSHSKPPVKPRLKENDNLLVFQTDKK